MKYTCQNDIWGFCSGEPDWKIKPIIEYSEPDEKGNRKPIIRQVGICNNDYKTCEKYLNHSKTIDASKIPVGHLVETIIPKENKEALEKKNRTKSKAAKKLEQEMMQGNLL